ncbi:hypothetical protein PMG11_06133 [Penicillium brasilianum]|uniref:Uncharacterized protein n=1 Tax=Penicillium brasilianum TaxID=104259 RepID=A0A0F7TNN0_PENBI|nr:hypothetical protein PMG11_06133 [Penicillium brasilianum]
MRHEDADVIITDQLERYLDNNPSKAKWISGFVMQQISGLSLILYCWNEIVHFHPWARSFILSAERKQSVSGPPSQHLEPLKKKFDDALKAEDLALLGRFFCTEQLSVIWPGGEPNRMYTNQRKAAEVELDKFWLKIDSLVQSVVDKVPNDARPPFRPPPAGTLARTPDWIDEAPAPKAAKRGWDTTDLAKGAEPAPQAKRPRKDKTGGTPDPSRAVPEAGAAEGGADLQAAPEPVRIKVSKEDFEVITMLFHIPGQTPKKDFSWRRFVQAMGGLQFTIQKTWGSAWLFTPPADLGNHSITFYDPHPDNAHPLYIWRRIGSRLTDHSGWEGSTFEEGV